MIPFINDFLPHFQGHPHHTAIIKAIFKKIPGSK